MRFMAHLHIPTPGSGQRIIPLFLGHANLFIIKIKVLRRSVEPAVERVHRIALVVGTVLNLINQGPRWFHGDGLLLGYCLLNYMVPYCVAAYGAVRTGLQNLRATERQKQVEWPY